MRTVAWLLILAGGIFFCYNMYHWQKETSVVEQNDQLAASVAPDWHVQTTMPSLKQGIPVPPPPVRQGEKLGELVIPKLGRILPIVKGTDPDSLKKGVGLYQGHGTVYPGDTGHVVLSGHRDTVFRDLGKLKIGDRLYIKYGNHLFTYQIRKSWITHADDRTVIVPISHPVLTLSTCYPFDFVGDAPDRYIIRAELIQIQEGENEDDHRSRIDQSR
jgi:sortase A